MNQDWETITFKKKTGGRGGGRGRGGGPVVTEKKFNAGTNKQRAPTVNPNKLMSDLSNDDEGAPVRLNTVSREQAQAIQQGRQAKSWTQKDFATRINEKASVVNDYEQGKAIPNQQVLGKMERALGVKLRGKDIGSTLEPRGKKKTSAK